MKSRLSYDAFIALVNAETVEQFLVEKDMLGLAGQFNQQDSFELVTVLVVRHYSSLADELCHRGIFKVGDYFVKMNKCASAGGRQHYINEGIDKIIVKHYKPKPNED